MYSVTGETIHIPVWQIDVVNSSGADDALFATLIDELMCISLSDVANRDRLVAASPMNLETPGAYATTVASISVSHLNVNSPTREELAPVYDVYSFSIFAEARQGVFRVEPRKSSPSSTGPNRPPP